MLESGLEEGQIPSSGVFSDEIGAKPVLDSGRSMLSVMVLMEGR